MDRLLRVHAWAFSIQLRGEILSLLNLWRFVSGGGDTGKKPPSGHVKRSPSCFLVYVTAEFEGYHRNEELTDWS